MPKTLFATLCACALFAGLTAVTRAPAAADAEERAAVERAVLDYVEGIYEVKPELITRSVDPELTKYGYARNPDGAYQGYAMTFEELHGLAGEWNASGERADDDSPKRVQVLDLSDQTAAAKLTAAWGIDYMHLAKVEGKWMIRHVIWQTPPSKD